MNIDPVVARIALSCLALAAFVGAALLPTVKAEMLSAGVGLLAWAHAPVPGEAARQQQIGAAKEAAAQRIDMTTIPPQPMLPPMPVPPKVYRKDDQ